MTDDLDVRSDIALDFGMPMQLEFEGVKTRAKSMLVGAEPGNYLIIKIIDDVVAIGSRLFKGNPVVVRYLYEGTVYAFQSQTLGSISNPTRLLFVAYPRVIARQEIRSQPRVACMLPATLRAGEKTAHGLILDISKRGCRLSVTRNPAGEEEVSLTPGAEVTVAFQVPGVERELTAPGVVKNVNTEEEKPELGIAFGEIDEATDRTLSEKLLDVVPK